MANPRQRRKLRSGSHTPVHHSRQAKRLLKKQPPIKGPKVLQEAWDKHKTVRQNYEALGLVASLNPNASGGSETRVQGEVKESVGEVVSHEEKEGGIPKGYGRIIRDENGNIVDVELGESEEEDEEERLPEDVFEDSKEKGAAEWVAVGSRGDSSSTHVVQGKHPLFRSRVDIGITYVITALEEMSQGGGGKMPRYTSLGELKTLRKLVEKHSDDVEAMARDRKLNVEQRTAGELRRAIQKAGGLSLLRTNGWQRRQRGAGGSKCARLNGSRRIIDPPSDRQVARYGNEQAGTKLVGKWRHILPSSGSLAENLIWGRRTRGSNQLECVHSRP
ncbi:ribosome biogenesis protein Nop16-domain-containing protein [Abortiporus biennis]|nr:ribosome biogenesis protein Nop16-domain-containing protein [Abortiporus biennis]